MGSKENEKQEAKQSLIFHHDIDKYILRFLDFIDLLNYSQVNKTTNKIAEDFLKKEFFQVNDSKKINQTICTMPAKLIPKFRELFRQHPVYENLKNKLIKSTTENSLQVTPDDYACFLIMRKTEDSHLLESICLRSEKFMKMSFVFTKDFLEREIVAKEKFKKFEQEFYTYISERNMSSKNSLEWPDFFNDFYYDDIVKKYMMLKTLLITKQIENTKQIYTDFDPEKFDQLLLDSKILNVSGMNLHRLKAELVNFSHSNFINTNIEDSILQQVNFSFANLMNANLSNCDLSFADLSHANLTNANLRNSDLSFAILIGAKIVNSDLSNAKAINSSTFLSKEVYFSQAKLNEELNYWEIQLKDFSQKQKSTLRAAIVNDLIYTTDLVINTWSSSTNTKRIPELNIDTALEVLKNACEHPIFSHQNSTKKMLNNASLSIFKIPLTTTKSQDLLIKQINKFEAEKLKLNKTATNRAISLVQSFIRRNDWS